MRTQVREDARVGVNSSRVYDAKLVLADAIRHARSAGLGCGNTPWQLSSNSSSLSRSTVPQSSAGASALFTSMFVPLLSGLSLDSLPLKCTGAPTPILGLTTTARPSKTRWWWWSEGAVLVVGH
eukprot:1656578-Pleurochrysis_carterae.AAC.1